MGLEYALSTPDIDDHSLRALAYELKQPLIRLARQAELADPSNFNAMQQTAEQTLQLIDSYLLTAQTEYGQAALDLSPVNAGSILYDVAVQLRGQAKNQNTTLTLDSRAQEMVMTHRTALGSILNIFGMTMMAINQDHRSELTLRSYKTRSGAVGVGIFGASKITQSDLQTALALQGKAHMPLSKFSSTSNVSLGIANGLCKAIGGSLSVKQMGRLSGFATELPRSEQLALV